ncbi:MAG: hypothetical protein QXO57_02540 [Candidatus Aenigmatarchaeota archaeon]
MDFKKLLTVLMSTLMFLSPVALALSEYQVTLTAQTTTEPSGLGTNDKDWYKGSFTFEGKTKSVAVDDSPTNSTFSQVALDWNNDGDYSDETDAVAQEGDTLRVGTNTQTDPNECFVSDVDSTSSPTRVILTQEVCAGGTTAGVGLDTTGLMASVSGLFGVIIGLIPLIIIINFLMKFVKGFTFTSQATIYTVNFVRNVLPKIAITMISLGVMVTPALAQTTSQSQLDFGTLLAPIISLIPIILVINILMRFMDAFKL